MSVALLLVFLIPLDVYTSDPKNEILQLGVTKSFFHKAMFISYSISLIITFMLLPFAFFWSENISDENYIDHFISSIRRTFIFLLIISIFVLCCLGFLGKDTKVIQENFKSFEWIGRLFEEEEFGEKGLYFFIGIFSLIGFSFWVGYTSYGMSVLPIYLIKGKQSLEKSKENYCYEREKKKEEISDIKSASADKKEYLQQLQKEVENLTRKMNKITTLMKEGKLLGFIFYLMKPFRIVIGICCLAVSVIVMLSILTSLVDQMANSKCGISCGFITESKQRTLIDDYLLLYSKYFHLDPLYYTLLVSYIFISSVYGMCKNGIKICCIKLYEFKKENTTTRAMMIFAFKASLMLLVLLVEIIFLMPQYSSFGKQKSKEKFCTVKFKDCYISNIGIFYNKINVTFPLYGTLFFIGNWVFLLLILFRLTYNFFCYHEEELDDYKSEFEDDEEKMALNSEDF